MTNEKLISEIVSNLAAVLTRSCNDDPNAVRAISQLWELSDVLNRRTCNLGLVLAYLRNRSDDFYIDSLPSKKD